MIKLDSVSELYTLKFYTEGSLEEQRVKALDDITLSIHDGEAVNIIGENGSGKTTLLKAVAGHIDPSLGKISVSGRVGCIMDIGSGFHPELTGYENVKALSPLYGISSSEIEEKVEEIKQFADLGKYFNAPLRTYSQGMFLRLAFAYAVSITPDILCVDDIVSVGDERVRHKCLEKIEEFKAKGVTVLLVTHDLSFARQFSGRTLWMKEGKLWKDGATDSVIEDYLAHIRKDRPLFFPVSLFSLEKESPRPRLFYKNRLLADPFALSLQVGDLVCERWEDMEAGFDFLRFEKQFLFYSLEIVCSLKIRDRVTFEVFIKDMKRPLRTPVSLKVVIPVKQGIRAFEAENVKHRDLQNEAVYWAAFDQEYLDMKIISEPAWEVQCTEDRQALSASGFLEGRDLFEVRHRLFALTLDIPPREALCDRNKLLPAEAPWIGDDSLRLIHYGKGFSLEARGEELLEFMGLELLFEYAGRQWSSLEALGSCEEEADTGLLHLKYRHPQWPFDLHLRCFFRQDKLFFESRFDSPVAGNPAKNLRVQIFWKKAALYKFFLPGDPVQIECPCGRKFQIAQENSEKAWLFFHLWSGSGREALVTYLLIPRPENGKAFRMSISPNLQDFPLPRFPENNFSPVSLSGPEQTPRQRPLKDFCFITFYTGGIWHDSKKCLWSSQGDEFIGVFPWIPVTIKLRIREDEIEWKMEMTETLCLDRIQMVFPLQEQNWKWLEDGDVFDFTDKGDGTSWPLLYSAGKKEKKIEGESPDREKFIFDGSGLKGAFVRTLERTADYVSLNYTWFCETRQFRAGETLDLGCLMLKKGAKG